MNEKLYSKSETRKRLRVGRIRYEQMIESKILPAPISLTDDARPVHTESQIKIAENNLYKQAIKNVLPAATRRMKPLSAKLAAEIK